VLACVGVAFAGRAVLEADGEGLGDGDGLALGGAAVGGVALLEAGSVVAGFVAGVRAALVAGALGTTDSIGPARCAAVEQLASPKSAATKSAGPPRAGSRCPLRRPLP
jgi:hypothetical protein